MSGAARFVCLTGMSGSGKDAAGAHLLERHGFLRLALADPLKAAVMSLFDLSHDQLWGDRRNLPDARLGIAPREIYQQFGAACRAIDPDVWIRPFRREVDRIIEGGARVVCTDLRTGAEMAMARALGAEVWRLERPGAGAPGTLAEDSTETELPGLPGEAFDRVIRNVGTLADLYATLDTLLAEPLSAQRLVTIHE